MLTDKPHILIVDNEPASVSVLARMLAAEFKVQHVPVVPHVMEVARHPHRRPDLILLDAGLPEREGFDICRRLKEDDSTRSVPVILITQRDRIEDEARALELGAVDCISRPFRLDVVKARIRNQVRLKINNDLLERYANQDSLTDVANRRRFDLVLDAEWRRAARDGKALSLLMVDVDFFKQYNDHYGHGEGDQCLRRVAAAMARVLTRPGDLLARYGGEEFAVVLPGTDLAGARMIGKRLRDAIADMKIPHPRKDGLRRVTASIGCASAYPGPSLSHHQLLQIADDQLYSAKHSGRNCVRGKALSSSFVAHRASVTPFAGAAPSVAARAS